MDIRPTQPWHYDPMLHQQVMRSRLKPKKPYYLFEGGAEDYRKVIDLYYKKPVIGYGLGRVEVIHNPVLAGIFKHKISLLEERGKDHHVKPNWKNGHVNQKLRKSVDHALKLQTTHNSRYYQHVKLAAMFHGTKKFLFDSIFRTGFDNLATTDCGFFGKGIYNNSHAEYVHRVYSDGTLIMTYVVFLSVFPIVPSDVEFLKGGPKYQNYDAHYALVAPLDPNNPHEVVYLPIKANQKPQYDELVVFESSQVLPRYIVTLTPEGLNLESIPIKLNKLILMAAICNFLIQFKVDDLIRPFLEEKIIQIASRMYQELDQEEQSLLNIIENLKIHNQSSTIKEILLGRTLRILKVDEENEPQNSEVSEEKQTLTPKIKKALSQQENGAFVDLILMEVMNRMKITPENLLRENNLILPLGTTDFELIRIAQYCQNVTSLDLCGGRQISNEGCQLAADKFPFLLSLDVSGSMLTQEGIYPFVRHCPRLTKINVKGCYHIAAAQFKERVFRLNPKIILQGMSPGGGIYD